MKRTSLIPSAVALTVVLLGMPLTTRAAIITTSPALPPNGVYRNLGLQAVYYFDPSHNVMLSIPTVDLSGAPITLQPGGGGLPFTPADEIEDSGVAFTADIDKVTNPGGVSVIGGPGPASATGFVTTAAIGKIGNITGSFDTEMLALNLAGTGPLGAFMIRESPTKISSGHTTITALGGGLYQIDSFFDVFTELSRDGGASWVPSMDTAGNPYAGRIELGLIPEPTTMGLTLIGLVGLLGFRHRR